MWLAAAQALGGMTMGPKSSRSFFPNTVVLVVIVMADNILIAINSESLDGALEKKPGMAWTGFTREKGVTQNLGKTQVGRLPASPTGGPCHSPRSYTH